MKRVLYVLTASIFAALAIPAQADPDKNESGHGRHKYEQKYGKHAHKRGEYKEEYWDGNCKVERKWERNGSYKEERKCEGARRHARHGPHRDHAPRGYDEPVVVLQPPAVVIQPAPVVIR